MMKGFNLSWYHYTCCNKSGAPNFNHFSELKEAEYLRWVLKKNIYKRIKYTIKDDQIAIKKYCGEKIIENDEEKKKKKV